MDNQIFAIIWAALALALIAPAVIRMAQHNGRTVLESIAMWLGIVLLLGFAYQNLGIGEWWEERHGSRFQNPGLIAPTPDNPLPNQEQQ